MWTYFAEFQPAARRGGALSVLATFWMVGNVVVAGLAWAIIPHQVRHLRTATKFHSAQRFRNFAMVYLQL